MPAIITRPRPLEERTISAASTVAQLLERATCRPAKMDGTQAGRDGDSLNLALREHYTALIHRETEQETNDLSKAFRSVIIHETQVTRLCIRLDLITVLIHIRINFLLALEYTIRLYQT